MKRVLTLSTALLCALILIWTTSAYAVTGSTTVSATVPPAIAITVPGTHALTVTVGSQTTTNLNIGVKSNTDWGMTVYKDTDLTGAPGTVPSNRLVYTSSSTNGSGQGANAQFDTSSSPTNVVTGGTKTGEAGATTTVNYKLTTNYDDTPGDYNAIHTYTAVTQ